MKKIFIATALVLTSANVFAASTSFTDTAVAHSVTVSTLQLLNAVSGNTCKTPVADDVRPMCFGLIPPDLKKPTLVGTGCAFTFKIQCGNGISADFYGMNQSYAVIGPKNVTYDSGGDGIMFSSVTINGLSN